MVEREAGSKVSCTSNVRHGATSHDLVFGFVFNLCLCLVTLLVDDESITSITFV